MINEQEFYIEHETRLRILEKLASDTNKKLDRLAENANRQFDKLDAKIDSRFMLLIGLVLSSIIVPVMLHTYKLV